MYKKFKNTIVFPLQNVFLKGFLCYDSVGLFKKSNC